MTCLKCGCTVSRDTSFDSGDGQICTTCLVTMAQSQRKLTGDERKRLKKAVKDELAGVLPREALRELIEDGYGRLIKGRDFDDEVSRLANEIDRLAGIAMMNEMLHVIRLLKSTLDDQEDEIRGKARKLSKL